MTEHYYDVILTFPVAAENDKAAVKMITDQLVSCHRDLNVYITVNRKRYNEPDTIRRFIPR